MRIVITLLFGLLVNSLSYANPDTSSLKQLLEQSILLQKSFNPKQALVQLKEIENDTEVAFGRSSQEVSKLYYNIASCQLDLAKYDDAKSYLDKALSIFEMIDSVSISLADTYMLIGIYYDYMANYDRALRYYAQTESIYRKLLPPNDYRFGYLYNNIGICIFFQGDIQRALGFFNKTIAITFESFGNRNKKVTHFITNASLCHSKLNKMDVALHNLAISLDIAEQNNILDSYVGARIYHAISIAQFELGQYDIALKNSLFAHNLRMKHFHPEHIEIAKGYFAQADIYLKTDKQEQAALYLNKALDIFNRVFKDKHPEKAYVQYKLSTIAYQNNDLSTALKYINQSLFQFNYDDNIALNENDQFDNQILEAIELKARIHFELWETNRNILHLRKANKIYGDLILVLNLFRQGFKEDLSKELLAGSFFYIFEAAIEASYELAFETNDPVFLNEALKRAEYSTSFVLLENIRNSKAKNKANIPDSLLNLEQQLRLDIATLQKTKREVEKTQDPTKNVIIDNQSRIFDLKEKHHQLITFLEKNYHNYHYYKQDLSVIDVDQIQSAILDEDQVLLEYFVGEENIFVFVISQDTFTIEKIKKDFPLEKWIDGLRKQIVQYQYPFNLSKDYHEKLIQYAGDLCYALIEPIKQHLKDRLIIIPGGPLAEVPFECFIKSFGEKAHHYKKHHYLIQDHAISYCYSATLLMEMINNREATIPTEAIAFAPTFDNFGQSGSLRDVVLLPLQYNQNEVEAIGKIIGAKTVIGQNATESAFLKVSNKHSIIHFATHAQADNDNSEFSFLAFSEISDSLENEFLFVKDIYNIPLRADLVTLSACETGIGENRKGEGIISLARSFASSGTGSINTSLWKVNDHKMASLMQFYYKHVSNGLDKDKAMQLAKLELMSSQNTQANVHPFFWTAMIPIGDMYPLEIQKSQSVWYFVFFFIVAGMITLFIWYTFNKRQQVTIS